MITLYDMPLSGNCHKVRLLLSLLSLPYQTHPVDLVGGEQRSPDYLKLNPFGQVFRRRTMMAGRRLPLGANRRLVIDRCQ
jgi:hypothetical protein